MVMVEKLNARCLRHCAGLGRHGESKWLDLFVVGGGDLFERARRIFSEFSAQRVKLDADVLAIGVLRLMANKLPVGQRANEVAVVRIKILRLMGCVML